MKKNIMISVALCLSLLCGCSADGTAGSEVIGDSTSIKEEVKESDEAEQSADSSDSVSDERSQNSEENPQTSESIQSDKPLIEDGVFTLPDGSLSFDVEIKQETEDGEGETDVGEEGSLWTVTPSELGYLFSNENTSNSYTLNVSEPGTPISELTGEEMTSLYSSRMENFRLLEFNSFELSGCPAAYCVFSGMLSQVKRESTITILRVQSDKAEYQITFNQTVYDYEFENVVDNVVKTIKVS